MRLCSTLLYILVENHIYFIIKYHKLEGICEKFHLSHISFYNIYISKFYAQNFVYLSCSNNIRMTSEFFNKNKFQNLLLLLKLRSKQHKNEISTGFCSVANWNNELNERKKKMKNSVMFAHCLCDHLQSYLETRGTIRL